MRKSASLQESALRSVERGKHALGSAFVTGVSKEGSGQRALAPLNPACVVCGQDNPHGLHLEFQADPGTCTARASWVASVGWESFQGVIHGGVISAVLDEAMSKAIIISGHEAFTAEIRIRFRRKVRIGETLSVQGWVVAVRKRKITTEASLTSSGGAEMARAWATFLTARSA